MIIDTIRNAGKYFSLHPLFEEAFHYIERVDLAQAPEGNEVIGDGLKAIFSNTAGKTKEASLAKFECHDRFIDIQLCIHGKETIGWIPREKCVKPNGEYNPDKDVRYFHDAPDTFFELTDGQFAIFYPEDVHAPMIGEGPIKKLVIKVRI